MPNQQAHRLFLFNLANDAYVEGKSTELPTATTLNRAIRRYVFLMLLIAVPMVIAISLLTSFAGHRIIFLLPILMLVSLIVCAVYVVGGYLRDRTLLRSGKIVFGEVLRQDIVPAYTLGTSTLTRIIYRFNTPNNERIISK